MLKEFFKILGGIIGTVGGILGICSFWYTYQKFPSEIHPMVKEIPYEFNITKKGWNTTLEVVNYSGFDAYDVTFDFKYGNNEWISEWEKANEDINKLDTVTTQSTTSQVLLDKPKEENIRELKALSEKRYVKVTGAPSKPDFCKKSSDSVKVYVRTRWRNKNHQAFDDLRKYTLACTAVGKGRSYTFLPENR